MDNHEHITYNLPSRMAPRSPLKPKPKHTLAKITCFTSLVIGALIFVGEIIGVVWYANTSFDERQAFWQDAPDWLRLANDNVAPLSLLLLGLLLVAVLSGGVAFDDNEALPRRQR